MVLGFATMVMRGSMLLLMALGSAPFQCSSQPDPSERMEETPGQALYELAGEFRSQGNTEAWRATLKRIILRYPSSRFASMAEQDLAAAGETRPAP